MNKLLAIVEIDTDICDKSTNFLENISREIHSILEGWLTNPEKMYAALQLHQALK